MKKKFLSMPAILLLLLLFVLYGTTYADTYRTWEADDVRNVIYNYYVGQQNKTDAETTAFISNNSVLIQEITNYCNNFDNVTIYDNYASNSGYGLVFSFAGNATPKYYFYNNRLRINSRSSNDIGYWFRPNFTTGTKTNLSDFSSYNSNLNFLYTSTPIYSNDLTTILYDVGYTAPSNLLNGPYSQMLFMFTPDPTNTIVDVDEWEDVPAYEYSVGENITIGIIYVPNETQITDFSLLRGYYTGDYWKYIEVTTQYPNSYISYNKYNEQEDFTSYEVIFNRQYIQQNNVYIITWWDEREEPYQTTSGIFYIKNKQTVIQNGTIIPSGDKITGSIAELQEDINNNNDFWKETYDNLFTIDSGDAEEIINNFLESSNLGEYGLESGELAILNVLNGEPSDFIISWSSVIIPNLKDNTPTQLVPAGNINFSKVSVTLGNESYTLTEERLNQFMIIIGWVQLIMGISVVILTIANVWETLMRALGVGVGLYEENADEHSTIVNVGEDGTMRTTEVVRTPTKGRIWYIHKKY